jgi:phage gp36-like protein
MAYATRADIENVYGPELLKIVADLTEDGVPEDQAITQALSEASSEIDSYIGVRYRRLPIDPVPPILTQICRDMGIYRLSLRAGPRTTEMRTRYEDAIRFLEKIAASKITLISVPGDIDGDGDVDDDDAALAQGSARILKIVRSS